LFSDPHKTHTLCEQNAELLNVKLVAHIRRTSHWDLHDSAVRGSRVWNTSKNDNYSII